MSTRGYGLRHLTEGQNEKPTQPIGKVYSRLWRHAWAHKRPLLAAGFCVLAVSALNLVVPQLFRYTIDAVIPQMEFDLILWITAGVLGTAISLGLLQYGRSYLMSLVGQRVIYDLRNRLYGHLQDLSLSFYDRRRTGDLMARVTNDVNSLQQLITSGVMEIFTDVLTFAVILTVLFFTDWQLTLALVFTFPFMVVTTRLFSGRIRGAYREVQKQMAHVNDHLQETISSIRVVKSFANEDYEIGRFDERNRANMEANIHAVRLWSIYFPLIDLMNHLGMIVVIGFGARQVMVGRLSIGTLVAVFAYLNHLQRPVRRFGRIMNVVQQGAAAGERIFEILDTRPEVVEKPDAVEMSRLKGHIRFEGVNFSYDKSRRALDGVDFEVEPGTTLALVGPSGAGKTTIANLLARFYDPDDGCVLVDGHDLRDVTLESLRGQMGIVSQEILLLHGTVRDNIAYGRPGASEDEVEAAARAANAHDFIMQFPKGYDSLVGERGIRLSGGQRQRIAIARAILKDPRILILDEATSQLDSEAEHLIQEALKGLLQGRTSIVIAHRLSTIQRAHRILVLEEGRIAERGTHETLLSNGGRYALLHARQFGTQDEVS